MDSSHLTFSAHHFFKLLLNPRSSLSPTNRKLTLPSSVLKQSTPTKMLPCLRQPLPLPILLLLLLLCIASARSAAAKIGNGYRLVSIEETPDGGLLGHLQLSQKSSIYGPDIPHLQLFVKRETEERLRVRITDAEKQRWEVPYNLLPRESPPPLSPAVVRSRKTSPSVAASEYSGSDFIFSYTTDPFTFAVKRKSDGQTLFDSASGDSDPYSTLVFKDQYLEMSTKKGKRVRRRRERGGKRERRRCD